MIHSQSEKIVPMCLPKQNETLKRFGTTQKAREKSHQQPQTRSEVSLSLLLSLQYCCWLEHDARDYCRKVYTVLNQSRAAQRSHWTNV